MLLITLIVYYRWLGESLVFLWGSRDSGAGQHNLLRIDRPEDTQSEAGNVDAEAQRQQTALLRKRQAKVSFNGFSAVGRILSH